MENLHVTGKSSSPQKQEIDTTSFGITDCRNVTINPVNGELLRTRTRLFEILEISRKLLPATKTYQTERISYRLREFRFPDNWEKLVTSAAILDKMKEIYPHEDKTVAAEVLELQIANGSLVWWWPCM
jgi:hypothetical protein